VIYEVMIAGRNYRVELQRAGAGWQCKLDGRELPVDVTAAQNGVLSLLLNGRSYEVKQEIAGNESNIVVGHERFSVSLRDPRSLPSRRGAGTSDQGVKKITAPMPGKIVRLLASEGSAVQAGQSVIVIEAMKMQNELKAPKTGVMKKVMVAEGAAVDAGQTLAEVE
jgi:biotin carboxyl carrier protein